MASQEEEEGGSGGPSTQLVDSRPQLDQPLRVVIPVNAPQRIGKASQDQYIQQNAFSPMALSQTRSALPELMGVSGNKGASPDKGKKSRPQAENSDAGIKTAISDFSVLAFSSKRSGKKDIEAMAYVSLGVIFDNQENYVKAIENYQLYAGKFEDERRDLWRGAIILLEISNVLLLSYYITSLASPMTNILIFTLFKHTPTLQIYVKRWVTVLV